MKGSQHFDAKYSKSKMWQVHSRGKHRLQVNRSNLHYNDFKITYKNVKKVHLYKALKQG